MKNVVVENNNLQLWNEKENFISYLDVSHETLETYGKGIKYFLNYLKENDIINPTRNDLRVFRDSLKQNLSINTINSYLTSIRRFFNYLEINNLYENITKDVKSIKMSKIPKKQVLTQEQASEIYKSLSNKREKCLFGLAITTGLRGIELARANIEDIKIHNGEIVLWVQCKKHESKDEYVKLSNQVIEDIYNYVGDRTQGNIFISNSNNNKGNGVTTKTLRLEIKNIFKRFGLDSDTFSLHSLRRSAGTIAYNCGSDVYSIQQMLHHKSISTTQRYINQSTRDNNKIEYNIANAIFGN